MSKFSDLSVDLETLGKKPNAVISQVGLVSFNRVGDLTQYQVSQIQIDPQSCIDHGLVMDWDTVKWWMQQSEEARAQMVTQGWKLPDAMQAVTEHVRANQEDGFGLWGYAATFDITILESAFRAARMQPPWTYQQHKCLRTLAKLYTNVARPETEQAHVAHFDAMAQAKWCQAIHTSVEDERAMAAKARSMIH